MSRWRKYARILLGITPGTVEEYEEEGYSKDVRFVWFTTLLAAIAVITGILTWRASVDIHRENKDQQRAVDIQSLKEQHGHQSWVIGELQQRLDEIEGRLSGGTD